MEWYSTYLVLEKYVERMNQMMDYNLKDYDIKDSTSFYISIEGNVYEIIFKTLDYFKYIESGRRAGAKMPPASAISSWIDRRHITPYPMKNGKLPTKDQLTYIISRSIAENGIPAKPYLQDTVDNVINGSTFNEELSNAIAADIGTQLYEWMEPVFGVL